MERGGKSGNHEGKEAWIRMVAFNRLKRNGTTGAKPAELTDCLKWKKGISLSQRLKGKS